MDRKSNVSTTNPGSEDQFGIKKSDEAQDSIAY